MPTYMCSKCGCIENTALSRYWVRNLGNKKKDNPPLCSECDPEIGKWHGRFLKEKVDLTKYEVKEGNILELRENKVEVQ